jgi:hypothetical protein
MHTLSSYLAICFLAMTPIVGRPSLRSLIVACYFIVAVAVTTVCQHRPSSPSVLVPLPTCVLFVSSVHSGLVVEGLSLSKQFVAPVVSDTCLLHRLSPVGLAHASAYKGTDLNLSPAPATCSAGTVAFCMGV